MIGYYDHNETSCLAPALILAREKGPPQFRHYEDLPQQGEPAPETMIVNPTYNFGWTYWGPIKKSVLSHPLTKFVMVVPNKDIEGHARLELGREANVEFISLNSMGRLLEILGA